MMSCPTCSATMQAMGCRVTDLTFFWCPRCGTVKPCGDNDAVAPDLPRRCRRFREQAATMFAHAPSLGEQWHATGIEESINVPEDRPK